ncbi:FLJ37770-like protein [Trichonephila clavipes]|nr:FLJ37770-like protein [Trichonephila clavipes]
MEKRAVIKLHAKLGKSASKTYQLMKQVYGGCCLSRLNVFCVVQMFLDGRITVEDAQRPPISSRIPETIEKVRNCMANDRCASLKLMEDSLSTTKKRFEPFCMKI